MDVQPITLRESKLISERCYHLIKSSFTGPFLESYKLALFKIQPNNVYMHTDNIKSKSSEKFMNLYKNQKYDEAIDHLLNFKSKISKSSFHYNLGAIYLKKGDLAAAKLNFMKAKLLGFKKRNLDLEITKINNKLQLTRLELSYKDKITNMSKNLKSEDYLLLSLVLVFCLITFFLVKKIQRKMILLIGILFCFTPYFSYKVFVKSLSKGIILTSSEIRQGPSAIFDFDKQIQAGTAVIISKYYNNWVKIEAPSYYAGWITKNQIGLY